MSGNGLDSSQAGRTQETVTGQAGASSAPRLDPAGEVDAGRPRFKPADDLPGTTPPDSAEPGVIEIELMPGAQPSIVAAPGPGATPRIRSDSGTDLSALDQIVRARGLRQAAPTFRMSEEDVALPPDAARALPPGVEVPDLRSFITLQFAPGVDEEAIVQELNGLPEVKQAVIVPRALPPQTPRNEPLVGNSDQVSTDPSSGLDNQWYIFRCRAHHAWELASGRDVVIADIDWGYRTSHEDLVPRLDMANAFNAYDGGSNVSQGGSVSHGTGVLGIAGAADNNHGMAGFAFDAELWPIQADSGPGPALPGDAWANAINWVRTRPSGGKRKVIILEVQTGSYGNYEMVPSVNAAIRLAIASGVVVCVAAGNGNRDAGRDDSGNPIQETGSILVGATAYHPSENPRASFSNFGPRVVVSAPGDPAHDLTCSVSTDNSYRNGFGGTSGATPKVAGTVALMLAANPQLSHAEIKGILYDTGGPVQTETGKPIGKFLNSEAAVREAQRRALAPAASSEFSMFSSPTARAAQGTTSELFSDD